MRKRILVFLAVILCAASFMGCKDNVKKYDQNISELRTNIYGAENENMKVSAITGRRENPYVLDGNSGDKVDFTVITITPTNYVASVKYGYTAKIDGIEHSGEFLPHPFAPSLSVDIAVMTKGALIDLTVMRDGVSEVFALNSIITESIISADKALTIALNKLKPQLEDFQVKGKLNAEIYVRLTDNPIDNTGGYFWYVAFVGDEQKTYAVLLSCSTGDVCAITN